MTQQLAPTLDRAYARSFVDENIRPDADVWDRAGLIPEDLLDRIAAAGLWAPFLPAEIGGASVDMVTLGEIHEEVGRGCSSVRSLLTVHTMLSWALQRWGTADQRQQWGPELAAGRTLGAFCLSEPGAGSDTAGDHHDRRAAQGRLAAQRREEMDHQRSARRPVPGVRAGPGQHDRAAGAERRAGRAGEPDRRHARDPVLDAGRDRLLRTWRSGRRPCWAPAVSPPAWC